MPKNLSSASKAAISKANALKAASIGGTEKSKYSFELSDVEKAIGEFIERVVENINKKDVIDTGNITNITAEDTGKGFQIIAPAYLDFQSKGVNGTEVNHNSPYSFKDGPENAPSPKALESWSERRGLNAFAVSKSIQKKGITPKNLWEGEVEKLADDVGEEIANSILGTISPKPTIINKEIK